MKSNVDAVLIVGYDANSVIVQDPLEGEAKKVEQAEAEEMFRNAGNVFFGYIQL